MNHHTAKPEITPAISSEHQKLVDNYIASCDAGKKELGGQDKATAIIHAATRVSDGSKLLKTLAPTRTDSREVKAGKKILIGKIKQARNSLGQKVVSAAGNPARLTESAIIRAKSVSLNTFRTFYHAK